MATTPNSIVALQTPKLFPQQYSTADSTGVNKTIATGSPNGTKIAGLWANNSDAGGSHAVTVQLQRSGINYGGVLTTIPTSAGFANGVPPVNLMAPAIWPGLPVDSDGNPFIFLQSTLDLLVAIYSTGLTAGAVLNVTGVGGDF